MIVEKTPSPEEIEVMGQLQTQAINLVRFLYCDNGGVIRGKAAGGQRVHDRLKGGIGLTVAMQAMNSLDQLQAVEGMGAVGEVRLMPDLKTFRVLPYAPNVAAVMCDMNLLNGDSWEACPRSFLRKQIERARVEAGISIEAAFEPEWTLARPNPDGSYTALDETVCFSTIGMTITADLINELIQALEAQGLIVELYHPELGHGQHELSIRYAGAMEAADNHIIYRETVRNIAWKHGFIASFAPKPFLNQAGNGCHLHLSAWSVDDTTPRRNLFYDAQGEYGLSQMAYFFINGILQHLPALVALTCPSVNSYRRLRPRSWSTAYTCYGFDNREATVRIASPLKGSESTSINLEIRASDNSNNPYLALGGIIAAGLDGITQANHPGKDTLVNIDPATLSDSERLKREIYRLPSSLDAALDELESDEVLTQALGSLLLKSYLAVKRSEASSYAMENEAFELKNHFYKY